MKRIPLADESASVCTHGRPLRTRRGTRGRRSFQTRLAQCVPARKVAKMGTRFGHRPATEALAERREFSPVIWRPAITPHGLRHTWATWRYAATQDALRLMHDGGWSGLSLIERYAHLATCDILPDLHLVWGAHHPDEWERRDTRAPAVQIATGT